MILSLMERDSAMLCSQNAWLMDCAVRTTILTSFMSKIYMRLPRTARTLSRTVDYSCELVKALFGAPFSENFGLWLFPVLIASD